MTDINKHTCVKLLILLIFLLILNKNYSQNSKQISLDDVWINYTFYPNTLRDITFIPNTDDFFFSENNMLFRYSCKNYSIIDSLKPDSLAFDDYLLSNNGDYILFECDAEQIYRRSSKAKYILYNNETGRYKLISDMKIRIPEFSPNDSMIVYFKENNLYINHIAGETEQISFDGEYNKIINGAPDWVYEEELELHKAYQWSEDSRHLAYLRFDESHVKEYGIDVYNSTYPSRYKFKYPKVGEKNSDVQVLLYSVSTQKNTRIELPEKHEYIADIVWLNHDDLLIQCLNRFQDTLTVYRYNIPTKSVTEIINETTDAYIEFPDDLKKLNDSSFVFLSDKSGFRHIYRCDVNTKTLTRLTSGNWEVTSIKAIDKSAGDIYFISTKKSPLERHIYKLNIQTGNTSSLSHSEGTHSFLAHPDFHFIIDSYTNGNNDYALNIIDTAGNILKTVVTNSEQQKLADIYNLRYSGSVCARYSGMVCARYSGLICAKNRHFEA